MATDGRGMERGFCCDITKVQLSRQLVVEIHTVCASLCGLMDTFTVIIIDR